MSKIIPKFRNTNAKTTRPKLKGTQVPDRFLEVIGVQIDEYNSGLNITEVGEIPDTKNIPIDDQHWIKIPDVACVFVDMTNSTSLSATTHERSTARAYQLFTGTAVRLLDAFEAPYIDVRGDGVFALFNQDQVYRALAAAVTFKTFVEKSFSPMIQSRTGLSVGGHIGIDQKTVLVRKLGLRRVGQRTDRQNEVWAGKPVNMSSKLASLAEAGELLVSDRYYDRITDEHARLSCGCPGGNKVPLWKPIDVSSNSIFDLAWQLSSKWCETHGADFCEHILGIERAEANAA
jgi:class 3 adenylate cyclase